MSKLDMKALRDELDDWQARYQRLRVKGNLGHKELRDKLAEFEQKVRPIQERAKKRLSELGREGVDEVRVLARSLYAGWDEVLQTHEELSREWEAEAKAKSAEEQDKKRHS